MATPSTYSLPFGAFVSKSLGIYLRNLLPFAALSALVLAPWIVLRILLRQDVPTPGGEAISSILQTVLSMVLTGALTYGVVQQMHAKSAGIGALVTAGMQSLGRVFVTSLVAGLIISIGTLMLVVPGITSLALLERTISQLLQTIATTPIANQLWIVETGRIRIHQLR